MTCLTQAQAELVECLAARNPRIALGHWWDRWMLQINIARMRPPANLHLSEEDVLRYEQAYVSHRLAEGILTHTAFQLQPHQPFESHQPPDTAIYSIVVLACPLKGS